MDVSIICTIYNGESTVPVLLEAIDLALSELNYSYEIILVEDYSQDNSWDVIRKISSVRSNLRGIRLCRNHGQQLAMSVGMRYSQGKYTVIMDGDLQNPPSAIPSIIAHLAAGYDLVYTVSNQRNDLGDRFTSQIFWFLINSVLKAGVIPDQLMMKGFSRKSLDHFNRYSERGRTVTAICKDVGMRYSIIKVQNQRRYSGKSNYNFLNRFNLMIDFVLQMTNTPLNILIHISLFILLFTTIFSCFQLYMYTFNDVQPGYTSLILLISFFSSLILLTLGIIGRYLSSIYTEVRNRPLYGIEETTNLNLS